MILSEYCEILVTGRNPYPFVNALRESPVACAEQHCSGGTFSGRILRRNLGEVQDLAAKFHMELTVREIPSRMKRLRRFRHHIGIPVGFLLGLGLIFYQSNVVQTIEIQGAQTVDEQTILAVLEEEGIRQGVWIGGIPMLQCERRLYTSFPEIAWAGLRHTGNRLVVEISEARPAPERKTDRIPCNITARYDAQITSIRVDSGKLCHKLGDGVAKGELLVSGVRTDDTGESHFYHASAQIKGLYTRETELTEYLHQTETTPTGRTFCRRKLHLFGLTIPLTPGRSGFAKYREKSVSVPLCFLGFTLPCEMQYITQTEVTTQETERTPAEVRLRLHADIIRFEKNLLSDVRIMERNITYLPAEDSLSAHVTYQVEGEIGETSDIYR